MKHALAFNCVSRSWHRPRPAMHPHLMLIIYFNPQSIKNASILNKIGEWFFKIRRLHVCREGLHNCMSHIIIHTKNCNRARKLVVTFIFCDSHLKLIHLNCFHGLHFKIVYSILSALLLYLHLAVQLFPLHKITFRSGTKEIAYAIRIS